MDIKIWHKNSLRNQITKVRKSIYSTYADRLVKNRKEHVKADRQSGDCWGDVHWESNGIEHSTSSSSLCIDGSGCPRIYNNRHRDHQSAAAANSTVTKKPLALVASQTNCIRCTLALNENIQRHKMMHKKHVTVEQIDNFSSEGVG